MKVRGQILVITEEIDIQRASSDPQEVDLRSEVEVVADVCGSDPIHHEGAKIAKAGEVSFRKVPIELIHSSLTQEMVGRSKAIPGIAYERKLEVPPIDSARIDQLILRRGQVAGAGEIEERSRNRITGTLGDMNEYALLAFDRPKPVAQGRRAEAMLLEFPESLWRSKSRQEPKRVVLQPRRASLKHVAAHSRQLTTAT